MSGDERPLSEVVQPLMSLLSGMGLCGDCGEPIMRGPLGHWGTVEDTDDGREWTFYCRMAVGIDGKLESVDFHYPAGTVRRAWAPQVPIDD